VVTTAVRDQEAIKAALGDTIHQVEVVLPEVLIRILVIEEVLPHLDPLEVAVVRSQPNPRE
jgi:hypothetical protein